MFITLSIIFAICTFFVGIYVYYLLRFQRAFTVQYTLNRSEKRKVSIIVCARNEEKNIRKLLDALIMQDYDKSFVEIIVANDASDDNTEKILQEYTIDYPFIRYFNVVDRDKAFSPKKNALRQAIDKAHNEIILLTDADCIPTPNWIASHISVYLSCPDTDMVVGFSKTKIDPSQTTLISQIFEHLDFLVLMFAAQGAIQSGTPFSASGQNLSYKKESYTDVKGFEGLEKFISGDDLLLLQKFVKNNKMVRFANYVGAYTETKPIGSWSALFNQRARWASNLKPMLMRNPLFFDYLVSCFVSIGLSFFLAPILYLIRVYIFDANFIKMVIGLYNLEESMTVSKTKVKSFFWKNLFKVLSRNKMTYFWVWYLVSPFYILIVSALGVFSLFRWQDRKGRL